MSDRPAPRKFPTIKALRQHFGLTQVELAEKLGVHPLSVHNWEKPGPARRLPSKLARKQIDRFLDEERRKVTRLQPQAETSAPESDAPAEDTPPTRGVLPGMG